MAGFTLTFVGRSLQSRQHLCDIQRRLFLDFFLMEFHQTGKDAMHGNAAIAHSRQQVIFAQDIELLGYFEQTPILQEFLRRIAQTLGLLADKLHAPLDIFLAPFLLEPGTDFAAGFRGRHDIEPVAGRAVIGLVGDNGHDIAVFELVFQRYQLAVDLGPYAVMAHFRMNAVSKVNGNRAFRQIHHITFGRKDKDFIRENIHFQGFKVFLGVAEFLLETHHLPQPVHLLVHGAARRRALAVFLVLPMSRDTELRHLMHMEGANLNFQRIAARHHRGMQRLIAIGFRHGNIILEPARNRLPHGMDNAQYPVAVTHGFHQYADSRQIIDFADILFVAQHFLVNAVKMLGTPLDFRLDARLADFLLNLLNSRINKRLPFLTLLLDILDQIIVFFRFQIAQAEVLQFPLDIGNTQTIG